LFAREKGTYGLVREKGKAGAAKREKGKGATQDLAEISLDPTPRARTYARPARHETISRLDSPPPTFDLMKRLRGETDAKHHANAKF
jgi:hypothetical protein